MWLLDVNVPIDVAALLNERGIQSYHANQLGWGAPKNGQLVEAATSRGVRCLLTRDRLFGESAARALKQYPYFCVVLITIKQVKGPEFLRLFQQAWDQNPISPVEGAFLQWPGNEPHASETQTDNES